jgi:hypothetical protein
MTNWNTYKQHISRTLLQNDKNYSTTLRMITTKNGRKWLTSSDIKSGNEKKVTTAASKIEIAKYGGKQ